MTTAQEDAPMTANNIKTRNFDDEAQQPRSIIIALFRRIGEQPEFKEAFEKLPNAERNYMAGDFYNILAARPHTPTPESGNERRCEKCTEFQQEVTVKLVDGAARAATLAENTRCVKILEDYRFGLEYPDCPPGDCIKKLIESLRKAGGQG